MAWRIDFENYIYTALYMSAFLLDYEGQLTSPAWVIICSISASLYLWAGLYAPYFANSG
jgi:hypothetical protein